MALLLFSCHRKGPAENDAEGDREVKTPSSKEKENTDPWTNKNITGFLLDYGRKHREEKIRITTPFGDIFIRLYENTPLHRANFLYMTEQDYFDNTWFYRVSEGHVIQAGNNDDPETIRKRQEIGDYTIPAEITDRNPHRKGAVAAARNYSDNPQKRSDPFEFYIVLGKSYSRPQLKIMEEKYHIKLNDLQMDLYSTTGGAPHLDGEHTVFGEVTEGMDVVEEISRVDTDEGEWPLQNIPITVEIIK